MFRRLVVVGVCISAAVTALPAQAAFPGQNGKIAFTRLSGDDADVFIMRRDGSRKKNLTPQSEGSDGSPAFSADGRTVVYLHNGLITVKRADGSRRRLFNVRGQSPTFSPNGRHILFARERKGIFLMRADGSRARKIWSVHPFGGELVEAPVFSPDGKKIAFSWFNPDTRDIVVGDFANGKLTNTNRVTADISLDSFCTQPNFSPDGLRIVYERYNPSGGHASIWLMDPDGSNQQNLTPSGTGDPAFSPNGKKVVFSTNGSVAVIGIDGTNQVSLGRGGDPDWAPATVK
jgi:TolB protein